MKAYFKLDTEGDLVPVGTWPSFDYLKRDEDEVWMFEGVEALQDFVEQATELLETWNA